MSFRLLSLFSGIGLHDLGLVRAGWEIAAQVELDPWCRAVLEQHWPGLPRWKDVRDVTAESVRGLGRIDLVTGGFPCPDLSTAGKGVGLHRGERSSLWFQMLRIIRLIQPAWVLAENVPALYSRGIDTVLAGLEEAGYAAWPVVVGAWAVGAPHRRDRVWIVGRRVGDTDGALGEEGIPGEKRAEQRRRVLEPGGPGPGPAMGHPASDDERRAGPGSRGQQESAGGSGSGVGDAASLGRGEGPGREALAGQPAPGRGVPSGARQDGLADAERDGLRQLQQREPEGRLPGSLRDGGQAEPGGVRPGGLANAYSQRRESLGSGGILDGEREARWDDPDRRDGRRSWPAGRYQPQHPWEPPRLLFPGSGRAPEPGMGGVPDGSPSGVDGPDAKEDHAADLRRARVAPPEPAIAPKPEPEKHPKKK